MSSAEPSPGAAPDAHQPPDDNTIRALVSRLARPHPSGGRVVERAALLAEGADFAAVMAWITAHGGIGETAGAAPVARPGLHGARSTATRPGGETPRRFVLPPGVLT